MREIGADYRDHGSKAHENHSGGDRRAIPQGLEAVDERIEVLQKRVAELRQRLEPVLSPERPEAVLKEGNVPRCVESPVLEKLTGQRIQLAELADAIGDIIARLEV